MDHHIPHPSPWVLRWATLLKPGAAVLDLACGQGRHARLFAACGQKVLALDRDPQALAALQALPGIETLCADVEAGPWPLEGWAFDAVVVTNYLHRPLWPRLVEALAPGGLLIYETFMQGNENYGKPSNPDFLLRPGELLEATAVLQPLAFEQGVVDARAVIQRLCAVRGKAVEYALSAA
jgi:SAM-dependent methyltransferase